MASFHNGYSKLDCLPNVTHMANSAPFSFSRVFTRLNAVVFRWSPGSRGTVLRNHNGTFRHKGLQRLKEEKRSTTASSLFLFSFLCHLCPRNNLSQNISFWRVTRDGGGSFIAVHFVFAPTALCTQTQLHNGLQTDRLDKKVHVFHNKST